MRKIKIGALLIFLLITTNLFFQGCSFLGLGEDNYPAIVVTADPNPVAGEWNAERTEITWQFTVTFRNHTMKDFLISSATYTLTVGTISTTTEIYVGPIRVSALRTAEVKYKIVSDSFYRATITLNYHGQFLGGGNKDVFVGIELT